MQNDLRTRTAETTRTVQAWASRIADQVPDIPGVNAEQLERFEALVERLRTETEQVLKRLPGADQVEELITEIQGRLPATRAEVADLEARVVKAEKAAKRPVAQKATRAKKTPAKKASTPKTSAQKASAS